MSNLKDFFKPVFEDGKPYKGFKSLARGKHRIFLFKLVENNFNKNKKFKSNKNKREADPDVSNYSILVELEKEVLFLPQHIGKKFKDDPEVVKAINESGIAYYLHFGGMRNG